MRISTHFERSYGPHHKRVGDISAEPFTKEEAFHAGLIGAALTAGFVGAYADGPEALAADVAIMLAPSPAVQVAGVTGYVAGMAVRGIQAVADHI